mmetsp:Transcript_43723/g.119482  ORF Transcript_43723/g.119482 Transcript_43723/m.119482 type:complete len:210 (-) Transcript_43723:1191-1820(-)
MWSLASRTDHSKSGTPTAWQETDHDPANELIAPPANHGLGVISLSTVFFTGAMELNRSSIALCTSDTPPTTTSTTTPPCSIDHTFGALSSTSRTSLSSWSNPRAAHTSSMRTSRASLDCSVKRRFSFMSPPIRSLSRRQLPPQQFWTESNASIGRRSAFAQASKYPRAQIREVIEFAAFNLHASATNSFECTSALANSAMSPSIADHSS